LAERSITVKALKNVLWFLALLALAFAVRWINLDAHGPWFDETLSITSATGNSLAAPLVEDGQTFTSQDFSTHSTLVNVRQAVIWQDNGNAILYNVALHFWIKLFGTGDAAVRFLSLLCGLLIVLLVYKLCKLFFVGNVAWWATGFAALHPLLIRYSQEARTYALATLLSLLATLVFAHLWKRAEPTRWTHSLLYGLIAGTALLSHYLTAYIFMAHALLALLYVRNRKVWLQLLTSGVLAMVIFGAWYFVGGREGMARIKQANQNYSQIAENPSPDGKFVAPFTARYTVAGMLQVVYTMSGNFFQRTGTKLRYLLPLLILPLTFVAIAWRARRTIEVVEGGFFFILILSVSGLVFSFALAWKANHTIPFHTTYANFATPYFAILIAMGMAQAFLSKGWKAWFHRGLIFAQAAIVIAAISLVYRDAPWLRPANHYAAIADKIAQSVDSGGTVIYPTWADALLCNLYLPASTSVAQKVDKASTDDTIIVLHSAEPPFKLVSPREYWLHFHEK
jgi:uncharacterized membrane protein